MHVDEIVKVGHLAWGEIRRFRGGRHRITQHSSFGFHDMMLAWVGECLVTNGASELAARTLHAQAKELVASCLEACVMDEGIPHRLVGSWTSPRV